MDSRVCNIIEWLEQLAPANWAEGWDNVGLQTGSIHQPVHTVMTCLTVTDAVVDQAIAAGVDLLVAHHPLIMHPLKNLSLQSETRLPLRLVQESIALYVIHTNLDVAPQGAGLWLGEALGLDNMSPLVPVDVDPIYKIAVYVPNTHVQIVHAALCAAGGGHIGNYSCCTFASSGQGTFRPMAGSHPYLGKKGELETVAEVKLETVVPRSKLTAVIESMKTAHPYEEVAYDCYRLELPSHLGYGRVGRLPTSMDLAAFQRLVEIALSTAKVRLVGRECTKVRKVAVLNGSGADYINTAHECGADVYVTGDLKYHDAQKAECLGLCVIDAGHFATEILIPNNLAAYMRSVADEEGVPLKVLVAKEQDLL